MTSLTREKLTKTCHPVYTASQNVRIK